MILYIPIWLYSNKIQEHWGVFVFAFTFQSGYISTILKVQSPHTLASLHSTLVSSIGYINSYNEYRPCIFQGTITHSPLPLQGTATSDCPSHPL